MSVVTNFLLAFDVLEDEPARISEINDWLKDHDSRGQQLKSISDSEAYGGSKFMEIPLWGAAFNHLRLDEFLAHLRNGVGWEYPQNVRVMLAEEDDETYRMVRL